ncbi:unnamed protein product [Staurois parvus]|uniref:Uncharacterized protein n=1 Tax=Staurois parvus TaxID=386267 RepID=A0ABN9CIC4_9NEOB|nr:unnamed protein product [Staurois parvus]
MFTGITAVGWKPPLWMSEMVESEFGINNMKAWIHLALYQQFRLVAVV